jgi:hypothetical protein
MKELLFLSFLFFLFAAAQASTPPREPVLNAKEILLPVGRAGETISLMELSHINVKNYEALRGKHLGFFDKIRFKLAQRKLRGQINKDGTVKDETVKAYAGEVMAGDTGFHLGGFVLGLTIYGIIVAYLIKDEKRKARIKWAWIGLGVLLFVSFFVLLAYAGGKFR